MRISRVYFGVCGTCVSVQEYVASYGDGPKQILKFRDIALNFLLLLLGLVIKNSFFLGLFKNSLRILKTKI